MIAITFLTLAMITSVSIVYSVPTKVPDGQTVYCSDTGKRQGHLGMQVLRCCWTETVSPGSGDYGDANQYETWCSECENGGTRGLINCTAPEQSKGNSLPSLPGTIMDGPISDTPLSAADENTNPDVGSNSGPTAGGLDNLQSNNNDVLEAAPESNEDESTATVQEQTEDSG